MSGQAQVSPFRVEKLRSHAALLLTSGASLVGCFFVSASSEHLPGPERIGELLNADPEFFPFEVHDIGGPRTVQINRAHVLTVTLADNEARQYPGYDVAARHVAAIHLSNGCRIVGAVRVYQPDSRARLSDWARHPDRFRYVESDQATLIVNVAHVVEVSEASAP
jgi:hypothetical protein